VLNWSGLEPLSPGPVVVNHWLGLRFGEHRGVVNDGGYDVWVDVRCWTSILDVTLTILVHGLGWDSNGSSSVTSAERELVEWRRLVDTSESLVIVLTVEFHVGHVLGLELFHHVMDVVHTFSSFSHGFGREVGMAA